MPPPAQPEALSEKVQLVTVRVPVLVTPPPSDDAAVELASAIVRSFRLSVALEFTVKIWTEPLPLTVTVCPVPSIVRVFTIAGRPLPTSVIVPLTLKLIVSVPVPAAQSPLVVSDLALALSIASRRVQNPLPEVVAGSVVLLTVIVLPLACSPDWVRTTYTGASAMSIATSNPGRTIASEALRPDATAGDKARAKRLENARQNLVQSPAGSVINPAYLADARNTSRQRPASVAFRGRDGL